MPTTPVYTGGDTAGMPIPFTGPRFRIFVDEHDPNEEDGWRYKLRFIDHAYMDSDGLPVDAVCAGNSWAEAFTLAGEWIEQALATDHCIFI